MLSRISNLENSRHYPRIQSNADGTYLWADEPLPLFQSSTSAFFYIRVMDTDLRGNEHPTPEPCTLNGSDPTTPPSSFSILHDQIVDEATQDIMDEPGMDNIMTRHLKTPQDNARRQLVQHLDTLEGNEIIRLLHTYQDLAGMIYPIVNVAEFEGQVNDIWIENGAKSINRHKSNQLRRKDLAILQMTVIIALVTENEDGTDLIQSLHDDLWPDVEAMIWNTKVDLQGLIILTLMVCTLKLHCTFGTGLILLIFL